MGRGLIISKYRRGIRMHRKISLHSTKNTLGRVGNEAFGPW